MSITNTPPGFTIANGEINGGWVPSLGEDQDKLGMYTGASAVVFTSVDIELFD